MNTPTPGARGASNGNGNGTRVDGLGGATTAAASDQGDASVGTLLKQLAHEVPGLLRNEIALAKSEMRENMAGMTAAVGAIATGGAVALAGLVVLLMAAVYGLSEVMEPWLAALLVGAAALVVGMVMMSGGKRKLKDESLRPDRTMDSLRRDASALRPDTQQRGGLQ